MRSNWLECTSATAGAGDLTLSAGANGFPTLYAPWAGIRQIRYTILEYNSNPSSTNAILLRAEDGYCPLDVSGPTLKRSDSTTVVFTSWDGTNLYPKQGSATAPSKQSFGGNSGNTRIICSAGAEDNPFMSPIVVTAVLTNFANYGWSPLYTGPTTGATQYANGTISYHPICWTNIGLYSTLSAALNGSGSAANFAIYEVSKTALPGRLLADFGSLPAPFGAGVVTSSALATPLFLVPGWYWLGVLSTGGVNPNITTLPGPIGGPLGAAARNAAPGGQQLQTAGGQVPPFSDPAVAPTTFQNNAQIPWIGLR